MLNQIRCTVMKEDDMIKIRHQRYIRLKISTKTKLILFTTKRRENQQLVESISMHTIN